MINHPYQRKTHQKSQQIPKDQISGSDCLCMGGELFNFDHYEKTKSPLKVIGDFPAICF